MSYSSANQQPRTKRVAKGNWARMQCTYTPLSCQGKDLQTRSEAEVWYLGLLSSATDGRVSVFYVSSRPQVSSVCLTFHIFPLHLRGIVFCSMSQMSRWHEFTFKWVMGSDEAVTWVSPILVLAMSLWVGIGPRRQLGFLHPPRLRSHLLKLCS